MAARSSRRRHTRWILVGAVVLVTLVIGGATWLEATHPQLQPDPRATVPVPSLAFEDAPTCRRAVDESAVEELRDRLPDGARISSTQLYRCPAAYDQLPVSFAGEVVGDILHRRGGAWVQVNDDPYALETGPLVGHRERSGFNTGLSVWLPDGLADQIEQPGRPGLRGDVVLVAGTVHRADPDDGGGITLRAERLSQLAAPMAVDAPLHTAQAVTAVALSLLAAACVAGAYRTRRR